MTNQSTLAAAIIFIATRYRETAADWHLTAKNLSYNLYDMSERLNARIDEELSRKLATLKRVLRISTTEVVKRSIEHYYEATMSSGASAAERLGASGLIGCARGPKDLSVNYKDELARALAKKG